MSGGLWAHYGWLWNPNGIQLHPQAFQHGQNAHLHSYIPQIFVEICADYCHLSHSIGYLYEPRVGRHKDEYTREGTDHLGLSEPGFLLWHIFLGGGCAHFLPVSQPIGLQTPWILPRIQEIWNHRNCWLWGFRGRISNPQGHRDGAAQVYLICLTHIYSQIGYQNPLFIPLKLNIHRHASIRSPDHWATSPPIPIFQTGAAGDDESTPPTRYSGIRHLLKIWIQHVWYSTVEQSAYINSRGKSVGH